MSGDDEKPTCEEGDVSMIECSNDINYHHSISTSISERIPRIRKDRDQHVLLYVKRTRVQGKYPITEPRNAELLLR